MQHLAPHLADPRVIFAFVGFLTLWAFVSGRQLYQHTAAMIAAFGQGQTLVEIGDNVRFVSDAPEFEASSEKLGRIDLLSDAWTAFRETLIIPSAPARPLRATLQPETFFNLTLLRKAGVKPRYHASMAGMLVGAGLLFTFLGLAAALSLAGDVVTESDPVHSRQALHTLLDTASFKFITSLAGLFLSIVYTIVRNNRLRVVETALDNFNAAVERCLPLTTQALLQYEANQTLREQSAAFETFGNELAVNIGQSLDNSFDQRLGEHIRPLAEAMLTLASGMRSRNEDAMEQMMTTFLEKLSGGTRDHMNGVTESLAGLSSRLEGLQSGFGDAATRMVHSTEAMAARLEDGAEAMLGRMTMQMTDFADNLRGMSDRMHDAGSHAATTIGTAAGEGGAALARGAEDLARGLREAAENVRNTLEGTGEALARQSTALATAAEAVAARIGELDRATREAAAPFAAGAADLRLAGEAAQAATAPLRAVADSLNIAMEKVGGAASQLDLAQAGAAKLAQEIASAAQRFEGVDRGIATTVTALHSALDNFRQEIQKFVAETDGNLAKAAGHIVTMVRDLEDVLETRMPVRVQ